MPGGHKDGVDGIAGGTGEVIALEQAIGLGMPNRSSENLEPASSDQSTLQYPMPCRPLRTPIQRFGNPG